MNADYQNYFKNYIHHIDRNNNMDLVRYILAFGVLIAHYNILCGADIPWIISSYNRVGGFFALSGFVLVGSVLKGCSFKDFVIKRIWRIVPSYLFVIFTCSIFLSLLSTDSVKYYFTSKDFWEYIAANVCYLNFLHPSLPGVFNGEAVNGALWTLKVEWQLTLCLPLIAWICYRYKLNYVKTIITIIFVALLYRVILLHLEISTGKKIYEIMGRQFIGQFFFFASGILIACYYPKFLKHIKYIIPLSIIIYLIFWLAIDSSFYFIYLQPFVITLMVLSISLISKNYASYIDKGHNISYEIFLCHFPIMQILAEFKVVEKVGPYIGISIGISVTLIYAIITYILVGRLYIKRKNHSKSSPSLLK